MAAQNSPEATKPTIPQVVSPSANRATEMTAMMMTHDSAGPGIRITGDWPVQLMSAMGRKQTFEARAIQQS